MPTDIRIVRNTESVEATVKLLKDVISGPKSWIEFTAVRAALGSQGSLAKLSLPERAIRPLSLNTLKRIANRSLEGGFEGLDALRRNASAAMRRMETETKGRPGTTKAGLKRRVSDLESSNALCRGDLLLLTMALEKSLSQGRIYAGASRDPATIARCKKEQRELLDGLSLLRTAVFS